MLSSITFLQNQLKGKVVLVRSDLNVPLGENALVDDFEAMRINKAKATIDWLVTQEARVVMISHLGRDGQTLKPVADYMLQVGWDIGFTPYLPTNDKDDIVTSQIAELGHGDVLLLENLRSHSGEEANDLAFAQVLAGMADVYVNDAFPVSHRDHASVSAITSLLPAYAGLQLQAEYQALSKVLNNPAKPLVVILGGAKFGTKLDVAHQMLDKADTILLGGALAHPVLKAQGKQIGQSKMDDTVDVKKLVSAKNIVLPIDVITADGSIKNIDAVTTTDSIVDAGPKTTKLWSEAVQGAGTILWNGPLGYYEGGFNKATDALAKAIAVSNAFSVIGGGDTLAATNQLGMTDNQFGFVSTAGGAMLNFLAGKKLPGLEALQ